MAASGRKNADSELIASLARGTTVKEAARTAGVAERTAYRRLKDADFRDRVQEARKAMFEQALGAVASAGVSAVQTLRDLLQASSESVRLSAARSILEMGVKLRESTEKEKPDLRRQQMESSVIIELPAKVPLIELPAKNPHLEVLEAETNGNGKHHSEKWNH